MNFLNTRHITRLIVVLFSLPVVTPVVSHAQKQQLSHEGTLRKEAHDFLLGPFSKDRDTKIDGDKFNEITIVDFAKEGSPRKFTGKLEITLPPGSERVAGMFRYLVLRGTNLQSIKGMSLQPYSDGAHMHRSKQEDDFYRVQMAALPIPTETMQPITLVAELTTGKTVTINEIGFNSQGKLKTSFDDIPYRNLGANLPRQKIEIAIAPSTEHSIGGTTDLQRSRFFRYYAAPGSVHSSLEKWAAQRNFFPGRQIFKFEPALVKGYSKNQPKLRELPQAPGKPDLSFFDSYGTEGGFLKAIPEFSDIDFTMCFDDYPQFMSRKPNGRGTPLIEHFDDAAQLAAAYVASQQRGNGRSATHWEVKNESSIKSEWDYHYLPKTDSWELLSQFHNKVADEIHRVSPQTRVGGPASAWMQVQVGDFGLFRNQRRFVDLTAGKLDFYSHHFYEDIGSLGAFERKNNTYTNYLLGRFETTLDMFFAHMHGIDNVRPIIVSECGSLQSGSGPSDNWLRLRSFSAYLHKSMQRPDQIELTVPFIFLAIPWNPNSGDASFRPLEGKSPHGPIGNFEKTVVSSFFELWREFDGKRLVVKNPHPFVDATAVHSPTAVYVALTNMSGRQLHADLTRFIKQIDSSKIEQRRMYYRDGEVIYRDAITINDPSEIPVDVEESCVIKISLNQPLDIARVYESVAFYSPQTAVSANETAARFPITVKKRERLKSARLVIGVHREGGLKEPLQLSLNGQKTKLQPNWARDFNHLFANLEISVKPKQLLDKNEIIIEPMPGLTITSVSIRALAN